MVETKENLSGELPVWPRQVIGGKYVRQLEKFLAGMRAEPSHGNQKLFLDDVFILNLLAFFNPMIRSLRTAEDFSQTRQAQKHLSVRKVCKSTLSDFQRLADPQRLQPIIQALRCQLSEAEKTRAQQPNQLLCKTIAVDGTFIPSVQSHFVMRYRTSGANAPPLVDSQSRQLTEEDQRNGVLSDRIGKFVSSKRSVNQILNVDLREVVVTYAQDGETKTLRLITNLMDVSASTIAELYRKRWQVELFFRWLKCFGNFNHLMCHTRQGATTCFYVAVIAVMLMYLHTGFRPSKYTFAMMSQVASGGATLEDIMPILRERERRNALARESQRKRVQRKRALKNA